MGIKRFPYNIYVYSPTEKEDSGQLYDKFLAQKSDVYFDRHRQINFSIDEFNALNLIFHLNGGLDLIQICKALDIHTYNDYDELIRKQVIDCEFSECLNYIYYVFKNENVDVIKIDLPEKYLSALTASKIFVFLSRLCKKIICFTHDLSLFSSFTKVNRFG